MSGHREHRSVVTSLLILYCTLWFIGSIAALLQQIYSLVHISTSFCANLCKIIIIVQTVEINKQMYNYKNIIGSCKLREVET